MLRFILALLLGRSQTVPADRIERASRSRRERLTAPAWSGPEGRVVTAAQDSFLHQR